MKEIPQDLALEAMEVCLQIHESLTAPLSFRQSTKDDRKLRDLSGEVCKALHALEQPRDPAEVAMEAIHKIYSDVGFPTPTKAKTVSKIHQAYAERDEAVRELSDWLHNSGWIQGRLHGPEFLARVRKLFGFDKEKQ